nr:asparagine synthase (glutamine-hydrolyzing) [uncultured Desulfobacter sp.]
MCGITGYITFPGHNKEEAAIRVKKMADAIAHRGPDEEGFYVDEHATLGHKRLSIIDLSSGQQPMESFDANFQIVFNGEIYNYQEIQKELTNKGYKFRTNSDTEVILNAFIEWGKECVKKFNGMFAFVIWNVKEQSLFAARDRVGKKPFYYTWDGQTFAFASEMKALLAGGFSKKQINPKALDCYFTMGFIPVPYSIFQDIHKLPPAHLLMATPSGELTKRRYWELDFGTPRALTMGQAAEELEALLTDAVKIRLISEVPLGAFLSGGIDSSLVVSLMSKIMDQPVVTNTIGFDNKTFSELPAAATIAQFLTTNHHEFIVKPNASETIEQMATFFDEPFADSSALPTWHVCKMARKNVIVAISGDGGDEAFGGYTFRYVPHQMESRLRSRIPSVIRSGLFSLLGRIYPANAGLPKYLRLKTILENLSISDAQAYYNDLIWLRTDIRKTLYSKDFMDTLKGFSPAEMVIPAYQQSNAPDPVSKCQHIDIQGYMTDDVLVKVDRMSMAHALEVRNPLLDYRVMEFATKLPCNLKLSNGSGKQVLRYLVGQKLPPEIQKLPKQGFSIPAADWLRNDLKDILQDTINNSRLINSTLDRNCLNRIFGQHQTGEIDHSVFLWSLMMLGLWEKNYN